MGPCKITPKSPRGVCGADADLTVARNLLRGLAAGVAAHGSHAREVLLAMKNAAEGKLDIPILGEEKVIKTAKQFGIDIEGKTINELASKLADVLLEDLSRTVLGEFKTIEVSASPERKKCGKTWTYYL